MNSRQGWRAVARRRKSKRSSRDGRRTGNRPGAGRIGRIRPAFCSFRLIWREWTSERSADGRRSTSAAAPPEGGPCGRSPSPRADARARKRRGGAYDGALGSSARNLSRLIPSTNDKPASHSRRMSRRCLSSASEGFMAARSYRGQPPTAKRGGPKASPDVSQAERLDQKSMPPMPPPPGIAGAGLSFGTSATIASVVISRPATEAASCSAVRTTLAGSTMPASSMSTYSSF